MNDQLLDWLPIWAVYAFTAVILLAAMEGGFRYTNAKQRKAPSTSDAGIGVIAGAILALLAFLLAFVVGIGANVFQERRQLVVSEANAIGTAYLRAGYLGEPIGSDSRALLSEYLDWRIDASDENLAEALARSEEIHTELWALAQKWVAQDTSATTGQYIAALNEVIDLHTDRLVAGVDRRIPPLVALTIYLIALATMFLVGAQTGYLESRNLVALVALVLVLSAVLYLIVDLDRSDVGLLQVSRQALVDLQQSLPGYP
jgi:hypothetical protein